MALLQYIIKKHYLVLQKSKFQLTYQAIVSKSVSILPLKTAGKNSVLKNLQNLFFVRLISDPSWRNWLARSTVNRKVGGSSPPEGVLFWPRFYIWSPWHRIVSPSVTNNLLQKFLKKSLVSCFFVKNSAHLFIKNVFN